MQPAPSDDELGEQCAGADAPANATPTPPRERWVFACGTELHLFVAYMLCGMAPPACHRTLVLQTNHRIAAFTEEADRAGVWDSVVIAQDNHEETDTALLTLEAGNVARFFYFSWGFPALTKLFSEAVRQGWILCLADEGFGTYQPQSSLSKWIALHPSHAEIARGYDYSAVAEIWLMSPGLFLEQTHATIVPIDTHAFIEKLRADPDAMADFRRFFRVDEGWSGRSFSEAIYLRQYFSALGVLAEQLDAYLDREFRAALSPLDVCIKDHPGHRNSAYDDGGVTLDYKGPMEALLVARMAAGEPMPEWLVSPLSSAVVNCAMLGAGSKFVLLYKIIEQYCDWVGPDRDDLLSRCAQFFPEKQFFIPETWDDYSRLIATGLAADGLDALEASPVFRPISRDLRAINGMLLESARAARQREAAFEQQQASWQAEEQQRISEIQQAHAAREEQLRQEIADLRHQLELQRAQALEHEEQARQHAAVQVQALQAAAATQAKQLQEQVIVLQQELLERERTFTQQWTTWRTEQEQRDSETQQAHEMRENQQRQEIADLHRQLEAQHAQAQEREGQLSQQAAQQAQALQAAAAMQVEQLQGQAMALRQELLERERAFTLQWITWRTDEQQRFSEMQRVHEACESLQRQEIADLHQQIESQRAQTQQREDQLNQHAEQLRQQIAALQHDLLERERIFSQQREEWQASEQQRIADAQQAYAARESQFREDAHAHLELLRTYLNHQTAYSQALAERLTSLQSTWWWRLSIPWRRPSKWPDIARAILPPILSDPSPSQAKASEQPRSPSSEGPGK